MWENDFANDDLGVCFTQTSTDRDLWKPTMELRWFYKVLQQKWMNTGTGKTEWRDLPVVPEHYKGYK